MFDQSFYLETYVNFERFINLFYLKKVLHLCYLAFNAIKMVNSVEVPKERNNTLRTLFYYLLNFLYELSVALLCHNSIISLKSDCWWNIIKLGRNTRPRRIAGSSYALTHCKNSIYRSLGENWFHTRCQMMKQVHQSEVFINNIFLKLIVKLCAIISSCNLN